LVGKPKTYEGMTEKELEARKKRILRQLEIKQLEREVDPFQ